MTLPKHTEELLEDLAASLQVPPSRYEAAERSYKSVGEWLHREASSLRQADPKVYIQGSFRLGTAIRPVSDKEDYDVDLVCELSLSKTHLTQAHLKEMLGEELKAYAEAHGMSEPKPGRRCWTQDYADGAQFHMDTLPALPDAAHRRLSATTTKPLQIHTVPGTGHDCRRCPIVAPIPVLGEALRTPSTSISREDRLPELILLAFGIPQGRVSARNRRLLENLDGEARAVLKTKENALVGGIRTTARAWFWFDSHRAECVIHHPSRGFAVDARQPGDPRREALCRLRLLGNRKLFYPARRHDPAAASSMSSGEIFSSASTAMTAASDIRRKMLPVMPPERLKTRLARRLSDTSVRLRSGVEAGGLGHGTKTGENGAIVLSVVFGVLHLDDGRSPKPQSAEESRNVGKRDLEIGRVTPTAGAVEP
jgi:hypothetical protein